MGCLDYTVGFAEDIYALVKIEKCFPFDMSERLIKLLNYSAFGALIESL